MSQLPVFTTALQNARHTGSDVMISDILHQSNENSKDQNLELITNYTTTTTTTATTSSGRLGGVVVRASDL